MSIKHIEEADCRDLLKIIKNWDNTSQTEKVDGFRFEFGYEQGQFYTKLEHGPKRQFAEQYPDYYYMEHMKRYHEILHYYSMPLKGNWHAIIEAIPSQDYNIIQYDKKKIGNGIGVILSVDSINDEYPDSLLYRIMTHLSSESNCPIEFYERPAAKIGQVKIKQSDINMLESFVGAYGHNFSKPMRTIKLRKIKYIGKTLVKYIGIRIKEDILALNLQSKFGPEMEGIVIKYKDAMVKIVDRDKFSKKHHNAWHHINQIQLSQKAYKKDNDKKKYKKDLGIAAENFFANYKNIEIEKKRIDTLLQLDLAIKEI